MKNTNTRILAVIIAIALMCCLMAGCGDTVNDGDNSGEAVQTEEYKKGESTETGWTSTWAGLKFTAPEGTLMMTDEMMGIGAAVSSEILDDDEVEKILTESLDTIGYEMMVVTTTGDSLTVTTEKMDVPMTEKQYLELARPTLEGQATGIVEFGEVTTCNIAGIEFAEMPYSMEIAGMSITYSYLIKQIGDRMLTITITCDSTESREALLGGFSAI